MSLPLRHPRSGNPLLHHGRVANTRSDLREELARRKTPTKTPQVVTLETIKELRLRGMKHEAAMALVAFRADALRNKKQLLKELKSRGARIMWNTKKHLGICARYGCNRKAENGVTCSQCREYQRIMSHKRPVFQKKKSIYMTSLKESSEGAHGRTTRG
jgi:hypothetical protein